MLRTLTFKSKMGFGKFSDFRVSEIINVFKQPDYISWVYYHMSNISFHEDVLDSINIVDRIDKPGKDPNLYLRKKDHEYTFEKVSVQQACIYKAMGAANKKRQLIAISKRENQGKSTLRATNRGKI